MSAKKSKNTQKAYAHCWKLFLEWCQIADRSALPASPDTLQAFCTWSITQGYRLHTVILRLSAIAHYHAEAGLPRPQDEKIKTFIMAAKRALREEPNGKLAITYDMLRRMVPHFPNNALGVRNRAMILLAFAAGWRRSEIIGLRYRDLRFVPQGLELWLGASKTDQVGKGRLVGIAPGTRLETCPVQSMHAWLDLRGAWQGPLFVKVTPGKNITRSALEPRGEVMRIAVKEAVTRIGENWRNFGPHSLRAGMITEASKAGATESSIMQRTGHRSLHTLQRYIRPATAFEFNPLRDVL